jgi:hypothetical protein
MNSRIALMAAAAAIFMAGAAQAGQTLKLIPNDPAATSDSVNGINNAGQMTGQATVGGKVVAFVRDASGNYTTFSVNGDSQTFGRAIANNGDVLGYATNNGATIGDDTWVRAPDGTVTLLQNPSTGAGLHGIASAENASGVIVGDFSPSSGAGQGFILDGGVLTTFTAPGAGRTAARGVEDDGTIAGWAGVGTVDEAYLRTAGGVFTYYVDPNATAGSTATFFESINNNGLAVGQWTDHSGNDHPFTFNSITDTFTELDSLGLVGFDAFGVNDHGDVVLTGFADGVQKNYLYNANGVPEPATWAMMLTGFFGLGSMLRRRRAALAV